MSLLFVVLTQDVKKLKIQVGGYTTDTISPPRYKFGSPGADDRMYYLDQPRCRPISKKLSYLINRFRNNVYRREALPTFDLRKPTFSAPLARSLWWDPPPVAGSPPKCKTQCPGQTSVSAQNFNQLRSAVSGKIGLCLWQTDRQTANLIFPNYHGENLKYRSSNLKGFFHQTFGLVDHWLTEINLANGRLNCFVWSTAVNDWTIIDAW